MTIRLLKSERTRSHFLHLLLLLLKLLVVNLSDGSSDDLCHQVCLWVLSVYILAVGPSLRSGAQVPHRARLNQNILSLFVKHLGL